MKPLLLALAAGLCAGTLTGCATDRAGGFADAAAQASVVPAAAGEHEPITAAGHARLQEILAGRVAGEPQNCINTFRNVNFEIVEGAGLVVRDGGRIWVNVPRNPGILRRDQVLVFEKFGSVTQTCRLDPVRLVDRVTRFFDGPLFLNDFVPFDPVEGAGDAGAPAGA